MSLSPTNPLPKTITDVINDEEMYSYDSPSYEIWHGVANSLRGKGWTPDEVANWLVSKGARWAMDVEHDRTNLMEVAESLADYAHTQHYERVHTGQSWYHTEPPLADTVPIAAEPPPDDTYNPDDWSSSDEED